MKSVMQMLVWLLNCTDLNQTWCSDSPTQACQIGYYINFIKCALSGPI